MTRMPAAWDEVIYCRLHEGAAQLEVLVSHEACYRPGNSAVIGLRAVRPDVLRPRLSAGLLLVDAGQDRASLDIMQVACQPI
jgi:hypothetical protein